MSGQNSETNLFVKYAWFVTLFCILVILWGAVVRTTGSGAGCGENWPLCEGELIPNFSKFETFVELFHRITSGISFLLVVVLTIFSFKIFPKKHLVIKAASFAMIFMILEALVGAILVLFSLVDESRSIYRFFVIGFHLVNTYLLLGALVLVAILAKSSREIKLFFSKDFIFAAIILLFLGASGAIASLVHTLFPAESLSEGLRQDLSPGFSIVKLRIIHPLLACLSIVYLFFLGLKHYKLGRIPKVFISLLIVQFLLGVLNIGLLSPFYLQLSHLLVSDLLWIFFILLFVETSKAKHNYL